MKKYFEGIGRRKTSTCRVRIYAGTDTSVVNELSVDKYFTAGNAAEDILKPFTAAGVEGKYYFTAKVSGGGLTGQMEAIQLGIGRALYKMDPDLKSPLRKAGFVTRDPRMVERKKYNLKKARAKRQFSKR